MFEKEESHGFEHHFFVARDERAETTSTSSEKASPDDSITSGFYEPANREEGNPLEDEQKLKFFTGPLPGWEGGRRVAVSLQAVNSSSRSKKSESNPSTLQKNNCGAGTRSDLPSRELRATASDLACQKPEWDESRKPRRLRSNHPLQVQATFNQLPRGAPIGDVFMDYPNSSSSSGTATKSFGAVGDGRFPTSAARIPSSSGHTLQSARDFGQPQSFRDGNCFNSLESESHIGMSSKNEFSDNVRSSDASNSPFSAPKRSQRRRSYSNSDPPITQDTSSVIGRRVSRPVALESNTFETDLEQKQTQIQAIQRHVAADAGIVNPRTPPVWKCQGSPFKFHSDEADNSLVPPGFMFDPESFTLPFESTIFVIKSDNITDIRASIRNGVWCSSNHGHKVLQQAWNQRDPKGKIMLIFSTVKSSQYCGIAEMTGPVNDDARPDIFLGKDRQGIIPVQWIVVKDVPFARFENIHLQNGKSINQLRNAEKAPGGYGRAMFQTYFEAPHATTNLLNMSRKNWKKKMTGERPYPENGHIRNFNKPYQHHSHTNSLPPKPGSQAPPGLAHPLPSRPSNNPGIPPGMLSPLPYGQWGVRSIYPAYAPTMPQETFGYRQPTSSTHIRNTSYGQIVSNSWARDEFMHSSTHNSRTLQTNPPQHRTQERYITNFIYTPSPSENTHHQSQIFHGSRTYQ